MKTYPFLYPLKGKGKLKFGGGRNRGRNGGPRLTGGPTWGPLKPLKHWLRNTGGTLTQGSPLLNGPLLKGNPGTPGAKADAAALVDPSGNKLVTVLAMAPLFELVLLLMLGEPMLPPGKLGPINPPGIWSKGTKSGKASNTAAAAKAVDDAEELEEDAVAVDDAVAADDAAAADADAAALLEEKDAEEEEEAADALPVDDVPELDEAVDAILIMTFRHVSAGPNIRQRL